ncbi:hypothetical protein Tco_0484961 [Tanacetum coccineum]
MTSEVTRSKEINETGINKNEPPIFEQDVQEKPHNDGEKNKSSSIRERTTQPLVKPQQSSIPFPNRVRKEKEEALQQNFLENLKQLDINISFIEALVQIPKYAKYLKSLLTNKSRLEEACTETMNERCSAVLLNELPSKQNDPMSFTTPCQVFEKPKEAEDLAADHSSRPEDEFERVLYGDLRVMFEPDIKSDVWRMLQGYRVTTWKLIDSSGVHFVRFDNLHIFMLVERRYPLTPITITNMLNKKLQTDHQNEMCYQLLKLMIQKMNIKFRGGLLGLKRLHGFLEVTAAQVHNGNYAKCAAGGKITTV